MCRGDFGYNVAIMKKTASIAALIAITVICAVVFTACNNATTQGQLEDVWQSYEKYVYKITDGEGGEEIGSYVNEIRLINVPSATENNPEPSVDVQVGSTDGVTYKATRNGYLITGMLVLNDGNSVTGTEVTSETACFFELSNGNTFLVPKATYRRTTENGGVTALMNGTYDGSSLSYTLKADGSADKSGKIALGNPFYDNNEFHQSLRGVSTFSASFAFSFSTPIINDGEITSASLTAAVRGTETVQTGIMTVNDKNEEVPYEIECYKMTLGRATTVSGVSQTLYYAVNPVYALLDENGDTYISDKEYDLGKLVHVLAKIKEPYKLFNDDGSLKQSGEIVYTLQSLALK